MRKDCCVAETMGPRSIAAPLFMSTLVFDRDALPSELSFRPTPRHKGRRVFFWTEEPERARSLCRSRLRLFRPKNTLLGRCASVLVGIPNPRLRAES